MTPPRPREHRSGLLLTLALLAAAAAGAASTIPWTELTDEDALTAAVVRRAVVAGRTVFYPTPPKERAAALEEMAIARAGMDAALRSAALRHLAEARRELGDLEGAEKALAAWAEGSGAGGSASTWDEAARWGARYRRWRFAFEAAERALASPGADDARRALASDRIAWAEAHPGAADPLALTAARAALFPNEAAFVEEWVRALEAKGRLAEAESALKGAGALPPERRAIVAADLLADHGDREGAAQALTAHAVSAEAFPSPAFAKELARRLDDAGHGAVDALRARLDAAYDREGLVLLELYLQGKVRGDLAHELLTQVELRYESAFDRRAWLEMARLWESIDGVPEAFRARLAAANGAAENEQRDDLSALAGLALRAGARALPWGTYNDEAYRWAARIDVTPGFYTGGLSFLLTGFGRNAALAELEARRLPDRTFETARLLVAELARRAPDEARLPSLRVALMERHVERGEGAEALALLPLTESGDAATRAAARRAALLAMRQIDAPLADELRLWRQRLALLARDGTRPEAGSQSQAWARPAGSAVTEDGEAEDGGEARPARRRSLAGSKPRAGESYADVLSEAVTRLDQRDGKHQAGLTLLLGEIDRLPDAEAVWLFATSRIASWDLEEGLESRYRKAIDAFGGSEWWNRLARWYARRKRQTELKSLTDEIVARFRATELFARDLHVDALVHVDGQPNPFIAVSDALRISALKRFPWSPLVLREAEVRLLRRSYLDALPSYVKAKDATHGVMEDALLAARADAVLYADPARRAAFLADLTKDGELESFLLALEKAPEKTPVHDRLLQDGWTRLSRFERATPFADRLGEAYPGDAEVARDAMTLHRSLSSLDPSHAAAVERVARRAAPALESPRETLVALGETWQDLEKPEPAGAAWRDVVALSPRDPSAILEVATVFWDYGRMQEALDVLAAGRTRLSRPRMNAFEAGVLREEVHDLPGALEEYLAAAYRGELDWNAGVWSFGGEWRARDRLARLVARPRVEAFFASRIDALAPGSRADEERLVSLAGLLTLVPEEPCNCDDWIDLPNDAVGREERVERRVAARPKEGPAIERLGRALFAKTLEMIPRATRPELLAALRERGRHLTDKRWAADPRADVTLEAALLTREAALAPDAEARIDKEIVLAGYLAAHERLGDAKRLWAELPSLIENLPEGAAKIRALVAAARFAERSDADAAAAWAALSARYPRSLGVLEDRLEFLFRTKRTKEGLDLLEESARLAASGHRENLTERLAKESLDRGDLPRGKRTLAALLALKLPDERRVSAAGLLARVSLKEGGFDALALGRAEALKLREDLRADLWAALAGAARDERQTALAVDLLIESLNLRLDRARLDEASRLAVSAGTDAHLLRFFEAQRKRSPRDVRWAVAVREIHTFAGDLDRAIAAAKEATLVAPERESLQEETVQLFLRAGRPRDAGEFLETWAKTRKGDEKVASWRASLFVRAGDVPRALAEERASLHAWKASAARTEDDLSQRAARIARRFISLDCADAAWQVAVPGGDSAAARTVPLSHAERVEIALRADQTGGRRLVDLVRAFENDQAFRAQAPPVIRRLAKPEAKRELQNALLARLFSQGRRDEAALDVVWDFARDAGLQRFPEAVARRLVASPARPWGENPPVAFVRTLDPVVPSAGAEGGRRRWLFSRQDFRKEWAQYLVSRDRLLVLERLLTPLVAELDRRVSSPAAARTPPAFTRWFPVEAFARISVSPGHEAWRAMVARWLSSPAAYSRLLDATEGRWDVKPLVELVDEKTRSEFLARTAPRPKTSPAAPADPLLAKRDAAAARVSSALAALVSGEPGALDSKDVVRLRGPRTVGEILGDDPRFQWALFAPRPTDSGDDAIAGTGVDRLRFPGRLWGLRPGEAWYVLEALAKLRERDPLGPLVPLEVPARGRETERTLLAVRSAEVLSEMPLALALDEEYFADLADLNRLARRLHLLVAAGRRERAGALLASEIRSRQARARREDWLSWKAMAEDEKLAPPIAALDPSKPVSASLLAYLVAEASGADLGGPRTPLTDIEADVSRFAPTDVPEFRAALAERWYAEATKLPPAKTVRYLDELWANGAARYPEAAARKLGPWFVRAEGFLVPLDARLRAAALAAVRALPDRRALRTFADEHADRRDETERLLAAAELETGDSVAALKRLDRTLSEAVSQSAPAAAVSDDMGEGDGEGMPEPAQARTDVPRLTAWLRTFRASGRAEAIREAEARLAARVKRDLDAGPAPFATWSLALELATAGASLARVVADLDRSFARGEWPLQGDRIALVRALTPLDAAAARRWFGRLDPATTYSAVETRAALLVGLSRPDDARLEWETARERLAWDERYELRAFDAWRRLPEAPASQIGGSAGASGGSASAGTPGPAGAGPRLWVAARRYWKLPAAGYDTWGAELARHLSEEPYDGLAARAVLRSLAPAREAWVAPAAAVLGGRDVVPGWRVSRAELPRSGRAACAAMPERFVDVAGLSGRRFPREEIDGLLVDAARAAAATADRELLSHTLADLTERRFAGIVALRAELGADVVKASPRPETVRRENGRLLALRPRDLTWELYGRVLNTEGAP